MVAECFSFYLGALTQIYFKLYFILVFEALFGCLKLF